MRSPRVRDAGHAGDANREDGRPAGLYVLQRLLVRQRAGLVVAVGDEDDDVPPFERRDQPAGLRQRIEDGGAASWLDVRHGLGDRRAIARRPRHRPQAFRERDDEHAILRPEEAGEPPGRITQELHSMRETLAGVDHQRVGGGHRLGPDDVELLRHAVLAQRERLRRQAIDEPALTILHGGLEQHARHLRRLDELECRQLDDVACRAAVGVDDLGGNLGALERVLVRPFDRVDRADVVLADRLAVDEEPDRLHGALRAGHLRHDADRARRRRCDPAAR